MIVTLPQEILPLRRQNVVELEAVQREVEKVRGVPLVCELMKRVHRGKEKRERCGGIGWNVGLGAKMNEVPPGSRVPSARAPHPSFTMAETTLQSMRTFIDVDPRVKRAALAHPIPRSSTATPFRSSSRSSSVR